MLNLVFWSSLSLANDVDGDGIEDVVDCDDNDASVGEPTDVYYVDADGDGYGSSQTVGMASCIELPGYVTNNEDCHDGSADAFPGAAPNDSLTECMLDADGDGFGDPDPAVLRCFTLDLQDGASVVVTQDTQVNTYSAVGYASYDLCSLADFVSFETQTVGYGIQLFDFFSGAIHTCTRFCKFQ